MGIDFLFRDLKVRQAKQGLGVGRRNLELAVGEGLGVGRRNLELAVGEKL